MTLTPCSDLSAASWLTGSRLPWQQLVTFGPAGFEAYGRLRFVPDPTGRGQSEPSREVDEPDEIDLLRLVVAELSAHTGTPDDLYICMWDGWGDPPAPEMPKVRVPARQYYLFRGTAADLDDWQTSPVTTTGDHDPPDPAFIWPADRAWWIANDVDPHYAGIGGSTDAIGRLLDHPTLDIVLADPGGPQPFYR